MALVRANHYSVLLAEVKEELYAKRKEVLTDIENYKRLKMEAWKPEETRLTVSFDAISKTLDKARKQSNDPIFTELETIGLPEVIIAIVQSYSFVFFCDRCGRCEVLQFGCLYCNRDNRKNYEYRTRGPGIIVDNCVSFSHEDDVAVQETLARQSCVDWFYLDETRVYISSIKWKDGFRRKLSESLRIEPGCLLHIRTRNKDDDYDISVFLKDVEIAAI